VPAVLTTLHSSAAYFVDRTDPGGRLLATVVTLAGAGGEMAARVGFRLSAKSAALPYCASLLAILVVHETAHYLAARRHKVATSLPYFIPLPFGPGTLGAFIRIPEVPSRRALLDIGAAGPIAGFLVALPLLLWGVAHSPVLPRPPGSNAAFQSPLSLVVAFLQNGWPVLNHSFEPVLGNSLASALVIRMVHGSLGPGMTLYPHPVAFAAWVGLIATALNLVPVGQLDGGHVVQGLFGQRARRVSRLASWLLLLFGLVASWIWLVWWLVARLGPASEPPDMAPEPLSPARKLLGVLALGVLALTFVPAPFVF